ncbi:MAG TPA: sulfite exporter TauE/SafE family protein [Phycisphaerae bacterium]|nr:sulfite exporter TauE/SafE family protein [Phycisphaerae bacterium]
MEPLLLSVVSVAADWPLLLSAVGLGLCVGTITGLFGAGGGFIIVPSLNALLGVPMTTAVGTGAAHVLGGSSIALWRQLDRRFLGIRVAGAMAVGIPPGTRLGLAVVERLKHVGTIGVFSREVVAADFVLQAVFAGFLAMLAFWMVLDNFWLRRGQGDDEQNHRGILAWVRIPPMCSARTIPGGPISIPLLFLFGVFEGFVAGLLGIGGSVIMMPALFYLIGQTTKYATQTCLMLAFVSGLSATIQHGIVGNIDYTLAAALIFGAFSGTKLGTVIRSRITGRSIRQYFGFVVGGAVLLPLCKLLTMLVGG